jgi:hypothetical protein
MDDFGGLYRVRQGDCAWNDTVETWDKDGDGNPQLFSLFLPTHWDYDVLLRNLKACQTNHSWLLE